MTQSTVPTVGYVVKRYPRFSETFVVNEILAHETAGASIRIFSVLAPSDTHFQENISRVRAPLKYLPPYERILATDLWLELDKTAEVIPDFWEKFPSVQNQDVRFVYQAAALAREIRLSGIVHLHAHFASVATTVTRMAALFADVSYSFTAHAKDIYHETVSRSDLEQKISDASAVITVSDYNLAFLQELNPAFRRKIHRVYNGLDLATFQYRSPVSRPPVILGVGRLVPKKGFSDLVHACAILQENGRDFHCKIIGAGEERKQLEMEITALNLAGRVELCGPLPQKQVIDELYNASVLAAPCLIASDGNRDGLPTILLEAMACGTPCVSTDVTGIPEILKHRQTGLLVPQHDSISLSRAMDLLLREPELRRQLSEGGRRFIENKFDIHSNAEILRSIVWPHALPRSTEWRAAR